MKLISWNVNGFRSILQKGFLEFLDKEQADFFCIQETKMQENQVNIEINGYHQYYNYAIKKGYSGTAIFTKHQPIRIIRDLFGKHNDEGRVLALEYDTFYLVNVYVPNAQEKLARLEYRLSWEDDFRAFLIQLKADKMVMVCGDLNVAHSEIDLKNPKSNTQNPGFSSEERSKMSELLSAGFVDSFRYFYPDVIEAYTWWSYRFNSREKNTGWRIDYFLIDETHATNLKSACIYQRVMGSDHCPVGIEISELD